MNDVLFEAFGVVVTPWKIIGYLGVLAFGSRWVVQAIASRSAGRPIIPRAFWYLSLFGSLSVLLYFLFGKNDSVGILSHVFPSATAIYNLWLDFRARGTVEKLKKEVCP